MTPRCRISSFTLLAIGWSLCANACTDPSQTDPSQRERVPVVQFAPHPTSIAVGDTMRLHLLPMLPPGYVPSVDWISSDSVTVTVVKAGTMVGTVKGLSPGQAVITVAGDGASDSTVVIVTAAGS